MYFTTSVALLAVALSLVNLVLLIGVIARLRQHSALFTAFSAPPSITAGEEPGSFATTTVSGEVIRGEQLTTAETLLAFFSTTCPSCEEVLPDFVRRAGEMAGGRDRVIAVVLGDGERTEEFTALLAPAAQVVVEARGGPMTSAFRVTGYPSVLLVGPGDGGRLTVLDGDVDLTAPVAA